MTDKLASLIKALEKTDTYDRENALIELYIFLISQNCTLPKPDNTFLFIELSKWRDCSLGDGVETYYEAKKEDKIAELKESMKKYVFQEACRKCMAGIDIYLEKGDLTSLDDWIFDNEWAINDFLVELARQEIV